MGEIDRLEGERCGRSSFNGEVYSVANFVLIFNARK